MSSRPGGDATAPLRRSRVAHEVAEVIATKRAGAHQLLTLVAPGVAETARPGQVVSVALGDGTSASLLRRALWIHRASPTGAYGGTVEVVVSPTGACGSWLAARRAHDPVDVVGPLGRGFPLPAEPVPCVLAGRGHGVAPLIWLAGELRARGCPVEVVVGAPTEQWLHGVVEARRVAGTVTVVTDDGSSGRRAALDEVLGEAIVRTDAGVVYACGPVEVLARLAGVAAHHRVVAQVAVEDTMGCAVGTCQACVLPVTGPDGRERAVRACTEGPVLRGDLVRWEARRDHGWRFAATSPTSSTSPSSPRSPTSWPASTSLPAPTVPDDQTRPWPT